MHPNLQIHILQFFRKYFILSQGEQLQSGVNEESWVSEVCLPPAHTLKEKSG
jgi:hypothetical protein